MGKLAIAYWQACKGQERRLCVKLLKEAGCILAIIHRVMLLEGASIPHRRQHATFVGILIVLGCTRSTIRSVLLPELAAST